ncbi:MAG: ABC transporter permease subunit [Candidatus Dormiibacterota bacterium]
MSRREVWLLVAKELRQVSRSRNALLSGLLFPTLMLLVVPGIELASSRRGGSGAKLPAGLPPGLDVISGPTSHIFLYLVFPLFYLLAGLLTPAVTAIYTIVNEREQRTLELLMALPVTVREILAAKLIANLIGAMTPILPLFCVNAVLVVTIGHGDAAYVVAALVLLLSALATSVSIGLFLALVARDSRTANNLTAVWLFPSMLLVGVAVVFVPGDWRFYALAAALLLLATGLLTFCLRWLTFERYLA